MMEGRLGRKNQTRLINTIKITVRTVSKQQRKQYGPWSGLMFWVTLFHCILQSSLCFYEAEVRMETYRLQKNKNFSVNPGIGRHSKITSEIAVLEMKDYGSKNQNRLTLFYSIRVRSLYGRLMTTKLTKK